MSRGHEGALQESFKVEERLKSGVPRRVTTLPTYTNTNHGESADPTHRNQWRCVRSSHTHAPRPVHILDRAHVGPCTHLFTVGGTDFHSFACVA